MLQHAQTKLISSCTLSHSELIVSIANEDGVTPLHNAARNNNLDLVNYFLDQDKVDVNAQTRDNRTALYYAVQYDGDIDVVNSLLDKYATVDPDDRSAKIDNLLVVAIAHNKIDIAKTLLLADIDIQWGGYSFISGIHQAINSDNVEMIKILLERGARPYVAFMLSKLNDRSFKFFAYDYKFKHNKTLLHHLADAPDDCFWVGKELLERGAYFESQDNEGNSPLHLAAKDGYLDFVKMLCEMKQECINVALKNADNQTALDLAKLNNRTKVVKFLDDWRPHSRARRQIVEQFSEPQVATSSASRASWWVRDLIGSVFDTFGSITKQTYQSMWSSPYHESPPLHSISTPSPSVNVQGTLLLVDVLTRKFTGQSYVGTDSQSTVSSLYARSTSLCIVQQFERMLNRLAKETNSQVASDLDSFQLYRSIEHCLLSGQYRKINRILYSTAQDAFPCYDSVEDSLLVMSVEQILNEVLSGKCAFEFGVDMTF